MKFGPGEMFLVGTFFALAGFLFLFSRFQKNAYNKRLDAQQDVQKQFLAIAMQSNEQQREMITELIAIRNLLEKK